MIEVYRASCQNTKEIKKHATSIKRMINAALRKNRMMEVETLTKTYALIYSAYAEVSFLKVIHTPYGFSENYIQQIQAQRNLEEKWRKCINLAFAEIQNESNKGEINNKKQKLERIMQKYIIEPSQVRNKIAHGQWKTSLNSESTAINIDITQKIQMLDYVKIDILFHIYDVFSSCVEDLIESPHRAHYRYFYPRMVELEEYIKKTKSYSIEGKKYIFRNSPKQDPRMSNP